MTNTFEQKSAEIFPEQPLDAGTFTIRAIRNDLTLQPSNKHQYIKALQNYLDTGGGLPDPGSLAEYALTVGSSIRSFLAAAVSRVAKKLGLLAKSAASPENIDHIQSLVLRGQELQSAIKTRQREGENPHLIDHRRSRSAAESV